MMCTPLDINYGSLPDWLTVAATIATLYIAARALNTWKSEKLFDVSIKMLSLSRSAQGYIAGLRFALEFNGEIDPEIAKKYYEQYLDAPEEAKSHIVFLSRRKAGDELFREMLSLREIAWATFGEEHIFFRFYDRIIFLTYELETSHRELVELYKIKEEMVHADFNEELSKLMRFLYGIKEDTIGKEIDLLYKEMIKQRVKAPMHN